MALLSAAMLAPSSPRHCRRFATSAVRVTALYRNAVDDAFRARFEEHAELCRRVPGLQAFRYGPVFGSPTGESPWTWMAEFEFADRDAFRSGVRSAEMAATGEDVQQFATDVELFFSSLDG
jgi:uncharacterized protein (TIGR02118 family)